MRAHSSVWDEHSSRYNSVNARMFSGLMYVWCFLGVIGVVAMSFPMKGNFGFDTTAKFGEFDADNYARGPPTIA